MMHNSHQGPEPAPSQVRKSIIDPKGSATGLYEAIDPYEAGKRRKAKKASEGGKKAGSGSATA